MGDDDWMLARRWGFATAAAVGAREPEWAQNVAVRVLEAVRLSWPCLHGAALMESSAVTPQVRKRLQKVLTAFRSGTLGQRAVLDVLKDAFGDEPRRVAADAPFTSRPGRVLAETLPDEQERETATRLIVGLQSFRHPTAALWALDGCHGRAAGEYVRAAVASRRVVARHAGDLLGVEVPVLAALAASGRDVIRRALPGRWAALQELAREVLRVSQVGPDGEDRCDVEERHLTGLDTADLLQRALMDDEILAAGGTFDDFVGVLERFHRLPRDLQPRQARLAELQPHWENYRRSRQGRRPAGPV